MEENVKKVLKSATKEKLIEVLEQAVEENLLSADYILSCFAGGKITDYELSILTKIENEKQGELTLEEKKYIIEKLKKISNRNIRLLLKSTKEFEKRVIKHKMQSYFKMCWNIYPRKVGKQLGYKAFENLLGEQKVCDLDKIAKYVITKIQKYVEYCIDNSTEEQYILHFSTFCNSKKYL